MKRSPQERNTQRSDSSNCFDVSDIRNSCAVGGEGKAARRGANMSPQSTAHGLHGRRIWDGPSLPLALLPRDVQDQGDHESRTDKLNCKQQPQPCAAEGWTDTNDLGTLGSLKWRGPHRATPRSALVLKPSDGTERRILFLIIFSNSAGFFRWAARWSTLGDACKR